MALLILIAKVVGCAWSIVSFVTYLFLVKYIKSTRPLTFSERMIEIVLAIIWPLAWKIISEMVRQTLYPYILRHQPWQRDSFI